ncbi:TPA: hypothetical protein OTR94_001578 [Enterobacter roggenkampii]|nr:hypothetical protein [Enterobacter roggenkampii]
MWEAALKILKVSWKPLLVIMVLTGCGIWFGTFITDNKLDTQALAFSQEKQSLTDGFSAKERQWDQERLSAANQNAADLKAALDKQNAWQQKADELTRELAEKQKKHDETVRDLKKRLDDALDKDGPGYTGIGPGGLQLFREAFGYPGAEGLSTGQYLPATASGTSGHSGQATGTGGGLSPRGIVAFSAEYGAWCQLLEGRLQTINEYYRK